eukprot:g6641.t1
MTEDRLGTIQEKEDGQSVNAVSLQHVSKHALMVAMMALLQGAAGIEVEPNEGSRSSRMSIAGGALADWVFTDLSIAFGIILVIQSLMLWMFFRCLTKHFMVSGGLSLGLKRACMKEQAIQCNLKLPPYEETFYLEGRDALPWRTLAGITSDGNKPGRGCTDLLWPFQDSPQKTPTSWRTWSSSSQDRAEGEGGAARRARGGIRAVLACGGGENGRTCAFHAIQSCAWEKGKQGKPRVC